MRNLKFVNKEYYHIYNRGTDKRDIFLDKEDLWRFLKCLDEFNSVDNIGSLYENSFKKKNKIKLGSSAPKKLVNIVAYCLNQNHFHFILEQISDDGITKFMHRLSTGYTNYFNEKNKRSGCLFQGRYKAKYISSNEYLLHLSVYVNLNDKVHKGMNQSWLLDLPFSSFKEYLSKTGRVICKKDIILGQFKTSKDFSKYCFEILPIIQKRKEEMKDFNKVCLE
jgi:REP element-mobilizing transposase RayT